jgi:hypothetical protein
LLSKWWSNKDFLESISFDLDGRVVIEGDMIFQKHRFFRPDYFPSIIRSVIGTLNLQGTTIKGEVDNLESVGSLYLDDEVRITSLAGLKKVKETLYPVGGKITELPELEYVGEEFNIMDMKEFKSAPNLIEAGMIRAWSSGIEDLSSLTKVYGKFRLVETPISNLNSLQFIGGDLYLTGTKKLSRVNSLREVRGELNIERSKVEQLNSLISVAGDLKASGAVLLSSMDSLELVGKSLMISDTQLQSLPKLFKIEKSFYASGASKLKALPELEHVGETLSIRSTKLTRLPKLKYVLLNLFVGDRAEDGFRTLFPVLKQVGALTSRGNIIINRDSAEEIEEIIRSGELELFGVVNFSNSVK